MSVTTDSVAKTDADAIINELWPGIVQEAMFPKAVLSNFVFDVSEFSDIDAVGDKAHIPSLYTNNFSTQTQSTEGAEVTTDSPKVVDDDITVDTHKYVAFIIGDKTMSQLASNFNLNEMYVNECINTLIDSLESDLAGQWSNLSTNSVGDSSNALTDLDIREALEALDSSDFDLDKTAFFLHPEPFWKQVMGISKYYDDSVSDLDLIASGNFPGANNSQALKGRLYGKPLYTTSNVVKGLSSYRNMFLHEETFAFAVKDKTGSERSEMMSSKPLVRTQASYELRNLGTLTVADMIYGTTTLREESGVLVDSSTTATTT